MATGSIEIRNSDLHDNFVTILDLNRAGHPAVWSQKRLNGGASEAAQLELAGNGEAKVRWTATRTDDPKETRNDEDSAFDGGTIDVTSR